MSAIAGIIRLDRQPVDRAALDRMQAVFAPYGPDAQHQWRQDGAGLLHTLLRTTPEDSFDRQPLIGTDASCVLVFDGRLDNREELAEELGLSHADSAPLADSDLAFLACQRWDTEAAEHMYGAYALAFWQPLRQRLWLTRDPLGQRPLFWHHQERFFAFASLPKGLFCVPGVPRELCEIRMLDRLALLPLKGPESSFKDVYRVEPGQLVVLESGKVSSRRYHSFDRQRELKLPHDSDYLKAFQTLLQRAVANCLRSSGPIASQLSSGFDSSTVTALAAQQLAESNQRLHAFTAVPREGFDGPVPRGRHGDESIGASAVAARFPNIDHELIRGGDALAAEALLSVIEATDTLLLSPCNMAWVSAIHRRVQALGCKVLLTGQLGNMSISYSGETYLASLLRRGSWRVWWRELRAYGATHRKSTLRLIGKSILPSLPRPVWRWLGRRIDRSGPLTDYSPINPEWMRQMGLTERARDTGWDISYRPWHDGRQMRIAAIERADPGEFWMAADLYGFEVRDPTSDLRLVEFCLSVPDCQYLRDGETRWLLRRMMANILPPEILNSFSKGYQSADWYEGVVRELPRLREELRQFAEHPGVARVLDVEGIQRLLDSWPKDGWDKPGVIKSYRLKFMRGMAAAHYIRYVEGNNR